MKAPVLIADAFYDKLKAVVSSLNSEQQKVVLGTAVEEVGLSVSELILAGGEREYLEEIRQDSRSPLLKYMVSRAVILSGLNYHILEVEVLQPLLTPMVILGEVAPDELVTFTHDIMKNSPELIAILMLEKCNFDIEKA